MDPNSLNGDLSASDEGPQNYWSLSAAQSSTIISFNPTSAPYAAARVDQDPANYSQSREGTSVANSHVPLELRHKGGKQAEREALGTVNIEAAQTMTTTDGGSLFSYRSSRDLSTFLREIDGRMFNNQSDLYCLPSDDDEFQRLAKQHYSLALCMGGLYPCPDIVESVLDPAKHTDPSRPAAILDLGCGSGIWALDMSQKFPHASVVGVDLAPVSIDLASIPINLRFEIDDITMGLSHYYNGFDVVQARCIAGGIPNYKLLMQDVEACLRPGGVVIFMDGDTRIYLDDNMTPAPVPIDVDEPGGPVEGSWVHRLARETRYAAIYHGADTEGSEIAIDAGLWDHPLIDPETVRVAGLYTPVGPWASSSDPHQTQKLRYAGSLMRQDVTRMIRAWHPLLKMHGISEQCLEKWTKRADEEIATMKYCMSFHWRLAWGQRRMDTDSGSPPDTRSPTPSSDGHPDLQVVTSMEPPSVLSIATPASTNLVESSHGTGIQDLDAASSTISSATNFQPLQIRATREEAKQIAKMRRDVTKALPECTVTRLRATMGLDESTDGSGSSEEA